MLTASNGHVEPEIRYSGAFAPSELLRQNPYDICGTLWKGELIDVALSHGLRVSKSWPVHKITEHLCDQLSVTRLHDAMIGSLRVRDWPSSKKIREGAGYVKPKPEQERLI